MLNTRLRQRIRSFTPWWGKLDDVLAAWTARYEAGCLAALRGMPDHCVDFVVSNSVTQHIWRDDVAATFRELHRVVHPAGATSHSIDLRDTPSDSLHHLQF